MAGRSTSEGAGTQREAQVRELGAAFKRVARTLNRMRGRDTHLVGSELTHAQYELLSELYDRGDLPAGELAAAARLAPGTVTQMLDHLSACGHVERVRSDTDRRVVVTRLTSSGRREIEAKHEAWRERWDGALAGFQPRELQAAARVLDRLGAMFEEASAEAGGEGSQRSSDGPENGAGR